MQIESTFVGEALVITFPAHVVGGEHAMQLIDALVPVTSGRDSVLKVVIDVSGVELMNSSGLGMLVSCHTTLQKHGVPLVLAGVRTKVQQLLTMTHLESIFSVVPSVESALLP
jgi:anti-anti-sigma factor